MDAMMAGTRWVRLDVDYFHNPKVLAAGRNARDLHLASICWVGRYLTDGEIPASAVGTVAHDAGLSDRQVGAAVERAVCAGLWIPVGSGFELKDYCDVNPTRGDIERQRNAWKLRQSSHRSRRESP